MDILFTSIIYKRIVIPMLVYNFLNTGSASGQGQANVWYMGNGAGLDFNTVPPTKLQNGNAGLLTATGEGVGAMCDSTGALLFYTNGNIVYDRTHTAMTNGTGLNGSGTTEQTGTIVPKIGSTTQYYIISPMDANGTVKYSVVDMTLNGGLGDVVVASKNTLLMANASEACLVIPHSNGTDFWVLFHASTTNNYNVFLFASGGITGPTNYAVGHAPTGANQPLMQMKVNSCFNKIASAFYSQTLAEVVSFNWSTGVVSATGMVSLTNFLTAEVYGAEFSPSGRFIYISESGLNSRRTVHQFDLQAGNDAAINASRRYFTGDATVTRFGTLQLGPDAKIYVPGYTTVAPSYMSVIPTPDVQWVTTPATSSEFQYLQYTFNVKRVGEGLPPIIRTLLTSIKVLNSNACEGGSTNLSYSFGSNASLSSGSISWNFGDGNSLQNQAAPTHTYTTAGTYAVSVTVIDTCGNSRTGTSNVLIKLGPQVTVPISCPNVNDTLRGTGVNASNYTWSNNSNGLPVIQTGAQYIYNGSLPKTVYVQDPTPLSTYTVGNPSTPPSGNAAADVGHTYFEAYTAMSITSFQIYSRAAGSANLSLQNEAGTTTYWGPTACNPTAAGQTFTHTPNVSLAAGRYRLFTSLKTPFFRENGSADGGRNVNNVIDVLGEKNGTKGGSFLNIGISLPDPCGIRTYTIVDNCGAMPVELFSFTATLNGPMVHLDWITASEVNNDYFIVEKSDDVGVFSELTKIAGAGNSTSTIYYSATDENPFIGENYYRLTQVDYDGKTSHSQIVKVDFKVKKPEINVFPNPAQKFFTVFISDHANFDLTVTDMYGRIVADENDLSKKVQIDSEKFPNGIYSLKVRSGNKDYFQRLIIDN